MERWTDGDRFFELVGLVEFVESDSMNPLNPTNRLKEDVNVKVERFEDLKVWQEARRLVSEVYVAAQKGGAISKDFRFRDQITAAAVSVMSNIAEGFSRRTNKEFTQFLFIAKGSCAEVQSLLYAALDQGYLTQEKFDGIYRQADLIARFLSRLITYLLHRDPSAQGMTPQMSGTKPTERKKILETQ